MCVGAEVVCTCTCIHTHLLEPSMCVQLSTTNLPVGISRMMSTGSGGEQRGKKAKEGDRKGTEVEELNNTNLFRRLCNLSCVSRSVITGSTPISLTGCLLHARRCDGHAVFICPRVKSVTPVLLDLLSLMKKLKSKEVKICPK